MENPRRLPRLRVPGDGGLSQVIGLPVAHICENVLSRGRRERQRIPEATGRPVVSAGALVSAKIALRLAMREAGVSNVELARRMGLVESEVRRMLDFKHATKIGRLGQALALLGRRVVITVEKAA
jgi:antitoxin HicB